MNRAIKIFKGNSKDDKRGKVSFINSFTFKDIKRFYQLENSPTHEVRAFHGHMKEAKYFLLTLVLKQNLQFSNR
jgi:dTDP-4-dehydrorhamnose 3,5-epimerase